MQIIIPFYNGHRYLDKLLASIPAGIKTIIVDDLSDQPLPGAIRVERKGYFTGAVNKGLRQTDDDVLILNQDTYFTNDSWLNLIEQNKDRYGLIGEGVAGHRAWPAGYIHGTFMFIRRDVIKAVGPMNEEWYPLWGSTCDYQLRAARKGFEALVIPQGQVPGFVHERQGSYGTAIDSALKTEGKRGLFIRTPPMISVVIGCYNHGQFLQDAVNSLVGGPACLGEMPGQTFQAFEVIIVDDGSTDDTPEIGRALASDRKGIHYIRQHNYGSAAAMNTGIQRARGKYIAAMDADDMMEPGRLERMLRLQELNPHSVIYDDVAYFSQNGHGWRRGWTTKNGWELTMELPREYDFERVIRKNTMHKGLMYPKRAWEEAGGYPTVMNQGREDWAFNVGLGIKGWCGLHTGAAEYLYRRNWTSRTFTNTTQSWRKVFTQQLQNLYPAIYAGERPPMCCGGKRVSALATGGTAKMVSLPGAKEGMVILEYAGKNAGNETWRGPVTQQVYVIGGVKRRAYVDKQDAGERPTATSDGKGMLSWRENDRWLFKLYEPAAVEIKTVVEAPPVEIVETAIATSAPESAGTYTPDLLVKTAPVLNPDELSVTKLKAALKKNYYSQAEILEALETEQAGQNRKSVISALENELL